MNIEELQRKLIASAKLNPPADTVPYAFEKRIVARLSARALPDHWALLSRALWRGAAACVAVTLLLSAWSFYSTTSAAPTADLSQQFENTLLAAIDQEQPADSVQ
jgi:hypothetical protein